MDASEDVDISLFQPWDEQPVYRPVHRPALATDEAMGDGHLAGKVRAVVLETKSAQSSPSQDLRCLLNEMTEEARAEFAAFRNMREGAAAMLAAGDDAAQKLARADVKAATDAMSLIVRTLEKIDSLQRQLARDRELEAEREADAGGYEEARERLLRLIEDKAHARAKAILLLWRRHSPGDDLEQATAHGPPVGKPG